eukprot:TRINITY_DN112398_c0_g1_i1.p1 TRINITY_DN112398_c0_g1~~TRINITY_DN112398_c0_g1_i1.p1  ORF type:complete len:115 (-),score=39.04 TRINITY_DN112398_c0_g1_i1:66-410(-)
MYSPPEVSESEGEDNVRREGRDEGEAAVAEDEEKRVARRREVAETPREEKMLQSMVKELDSDDDLQRDSGSEKGGESELYVKGEPVSEKPNGWSSIDEKVELIARLLKEVRQDR